MTEDRPRRSTLSDVAAVSGVSKATVSRVLNGRSGVAVETRDRVRELLDSHGYKVRGGAEPSGLIELAFSPLSTAWVIDTMRGIEEVASAEGIALVITVTGDLHSPAPDWIDGVIRRNPVGVVLLFSDLPDAHKNLLRLRGIPFVIVDPTGDPAADVQSVGSGNWSGGLLATRHLIELGHRDIALINGPDDMLCSRARTSGYISALEEAGLPVRRDLIVSGRFEREDGILLGRRLLELDHPPTAIFAASDMSAFGVYESARKLGLRIPEDVSVVGYDDIEAAQWVGPPMTTVRQPILEMAEEATRVLLRMSKGQASDNLHIELATRLVVRESTAPRS